MKGYEIFCPVCHEVAFNKETRKTGGFKGATYTTNYYDHGSKECAQQFVYYPNYFGKGPKTVCHTWSNEKPASVFKDRRNEPQQSKAPSKRSIHFISHYGLTRVSKSLDKDVFMELVKAKAVEKTSKGWEFKPALSTPILKKYYVVKDATGKEI